MQQQGYLRKLAATLAEPVSYEMVLVGDQEDDCQRIALNQYIGSSITLEYLHIIKCIACGREVKKSYQQGYCFPCAQRLARCDYCIVRPEKCHYHLGTCREPDWGQENCFIPHIIYLANTSGLKVGITRHTQIPTRWIDQGAIQALPIITVPSRRNAGLIEVLFAEHIADKTNWRKMLSAGIELLDLPEIATGLLAKISNKLESTLAQQLAQKLVGNEYTIEIGKPVAITYPGEVCADKVRSLNIEKTNTCQGTLLGIKGQYLILDTGVLNIRKITGYRVNFGYSLD